jgi:hypothetical protein
MINGTTSILKSYIFQIYAAIYQFLLHMVFKSRNWFVIQGPVAIILISWNVIFIWETGYWTRAMKNSPYSISYKDYIPIPRSCRNIFRLCRDDDKRYIFTYWKCIKISKLKKCQKYFFINVWRKIVFDICFTEFGTALTTILPILFQYWYKYCYSDSRNLWAVMKAGGLAL